MKLEVYMLWQVNPLTLLVSQSVPRLQSNWYGLEKRVRKLQTFTCLECLILRSTSRMIMLANAQDGTSSEDAKTLQTNAELLKHHWERVKNYALFHLVYSLYFLPF